MLVVWGQGLVQDLQPLGRLARGDVHCPEVGGTCPDGEVLTQLECTGVSQLKMLKGDGQLALLNTSCTLLGVLVHIMCQAARTAPLGLGTAHPPV